MPNSGQPHDTSTSAQAQPGLNFSSILSSAFEVGLDLLFPPRCAHCGRVDELWCSRCQADLEKTPIANYIRTDVANIVAVAATGVHAGILREAVTALKYENRRLLAETLGERLAKSLSTLGWTIDMVLPVPMHTERLRERGYNQAQELSDIVAARLAVPSQPAMLRRERYTQSQVGLSRTERMTNLTDAFSADPQQDRTILLIDDVCTTGSTLTASARALLDAGAQKVYGLTVTVARA